MKRKCLVQLLVTLMLTANAAFAQAVNVLLDVPLRSQPKVWGCWATATTMLWGWKHNVSVSEETLTSRAGASYRSIYDANQGIDAMAEREFYRKLGLQIVQGQNPTVARWAELLEKYGPLSVSVIARDGKNFHALVVTGMVGDGTGMTTVHYIDPDGGMKKTVAFTRFLQLYEGAAAWPLQIVHWP